MKSIYLPTMTADQFIRAATDFSIKQILELVSTGTIPKTVANFAGLHDYIDANELGGFCDDSLIDTFLAVFPKGDSDDEEALGSDGLLAASNTVQNAVNKWIIEDGINASYA